MTVLKNWNTIQLYKTNQRNAHFCLKINISFLFSIKCFEPQWFIPRETVVYAVRYVWHASVWAIRLVGECVFETETRSTLLCDSKVMRLTVCFVRLWRRRTQRNVSEYKCTQFTTATKRTVLNICGY